MTKFSFFPVPYDVVFSSVLVSKSGFNLFSAVVLPSQTALWFMNKFDATTKELPSLISLRLFIYAKETFCARIDLDRGFS